MKSMTGYGRARQVIEGRTITAEVKAVNHRYLDCNIKAPRIYGFLDEAIKKYISQRVSRGKIDVYISIDLSDTTDVKISLNKAIAENYIAIFNEMRDTYSLRDDVSVMSLARMPEIFSSEREEADAERITAEVLTVLGEAIEGFNNMREIEGAKLSEDILSRKETIISMVSDVEARGPERVRTYREKLENKMNEVLQATNIEPERILTEAAIFADKVAVDEETVRLRSHLEQLETMANSKTAIGRKMDFLVQEMNREANTIGSKANDFELSKTVVALKAEIEKIREQIQNVE